MTGVFDERTSAERPRRFSLVPQLDNYPWLVGFVQTIPGKLAMLALFSLLLALYWPQWVLFIAFFLALCLFFPGKRHYLLVAASLASVVIGRTDLHRGNIDQIFRIFGIGNAISTPAFFAAVALVLCCCYLLVRLAKSQSWEFYSRRPVLALIASLLSIILVVGFAPVAPSVRGAIWVFIIIFNKYLWFLSYSLCEINDPQNPPFRQQLGHYLPFWYPTNLPIPKGAAYIRQIRAETPEELAACQLKGMKLLIWTVYLSIFTIFLKAVCLGFGESYSKLFQLIVDQQTLYFFFREGLIARVDNWPLFLDIPYYNEAFKLSSAGSPLPFYRNWQALTFNFFTLVLHIAINTHAVVAICRMAGYRALRNVNNPLRATSIAGFWNNYQYYFKELLVAVFYYPTFLRYFRKRPLLRYYAATMAAACMGNFLYHFLIRLDLVITRGVFATLVTMQSMAFYCFILGNGIFLSQLRRLKSGKNSRLPVPVKTFGVLLFYCLILIFGDVEKPRSVEDCFLFLLSLINLNP